jgi:penicillin amidase
MRLIRRLLAVLLLLVLLAILGAWVWLRSTLPPTSLDARALGEGDSVSVAFDSLGIPTIAAPSEADLFRTLGYIHARDRYWQMDLLRRAAEGRLAKLFGARAVDADRDARQWELGAIARRAWAGTADADRALFQAYADGVNHWLAQGESSLEHRLLRLPATPWRGEDSYAILLLEARELHNRGTESGRPVVAWPDSTVTVLPAPAMPVTPQQAVRARGVAAAPTASGWQPERAIGSNSWVVSGSRTRSGRPILANDPHLPLNVPSIWYLAVLHAPGLDAEGVTIPGVPGIVIGRNRRIAWGMTASYVDDVDEVVERVSPDTSRVLLRDGWAPLEAVAETIQVRNAAPVIYRRYRTSNGPLVRWIAGDTLRAVARRWTGQDATGRSLAAASSLMRARDWTTFRAVLAQLQAPTLGMTYADVDGHIGYQLAGAVPLRDSAGQHSEAQGAGGWGHYLPFDEVPSSLDAAPFYVTSNNRIVGDWYPHFLSNAWASPYRAARITQLLDSARSIDVATTQAMEMDVVSLLARAALPLAIGSARAAGDSGAAHLLADWDGAMRADATAPTLFWRWFSELRLQLRAMPGSQGLSAEGIHRAIRTDSLSLGDGHVLALDSLSRVAMDAALRDPATPRSWGAAHQVLQRHPLGDIPFLGKLLRLNIGPAPAAGGDYTVNLCMSQGLTIPYTCTEGPSMRFVADLASSADAWFILPAGQSGHPLSPHYRDQFPLWRAGRLVRLSLAPAR